MPHEGYQEITFMESVASRRLIYLSAYSASRATMSTLTNEQNGQPKLHVGGLNLSTSSTLRGADTANGLYYIVLTQSECSAVGLAGPARLRYSSSSCQETTVNINFTKLDSSDSMRLGMFALPNAAASAAGGVLTVGTGTGQITPSGGSIGIVPGTLSGVSIEVKSSGIVVASIAKGNYSGVSQEVLTGGIQTTSIGAGNYSGVSIEVKTGGIQVASMGKGNYSGVSQEVTTGGIQTTSIGAGTYSSVTFQGLSNYANISNVTLAAGTHSNVTIQGVTRTLNLSANGDKTGYSISGTKTTLDALNDIDGSGVTLHIGLHSGASVEIKAGGIQATSLGAATLTSAKFATGAIDAVALATDAGQEIADALLGRNIAGGSSSGRIVSEALYLLRNKTTIDGSTLTVFQTDDATSSWTAGVTTGANPVAGIDPGGP